MPSSRHPGQQCKAEGCAATIVPRERAWQGAIGLKSRWMPARLPSAARLFKRALPRLVLWDRPRGTRLPKHTVMHVMAGLQICSARHAQRVAAQRQRPNVPGLLKRKR